MHRRTASRDTPWTLNGELNCSRLVRHCFEHNMFLRSPSSTLYAVRGVGRRVYVVHSWPCHGWPWPCKGGFCIAIWKYFTPLLLYQKRRWKKFHSGFFTCFFLFFCFLVRRFSPSSRALGEWIARVFVVVVGVNAGPHAADHILRPITNKKRVTSLVGERQPIIHQALISWWWEADQNFIF